MTVKKFYLAISLLLSSFTYGDNNSLDIVSHLIETNCSSFYYADYSKLEASAATYISEECAKKYYIEKVIKDDFTQVTEVILFIEASDFTELANTVFRDYVALGNVEHIGNTLNSICLWAYDTYQIFINTFLESFPEHSGLIEKLPYCSIRLNKK